MKAAERPKSRLCLKLGQRKLSFQQQKLQTTKRCEEENSTATAATQPPTTTPVEEGGSVSHDSPCANSTKVEQQSSVTNYSSPADSSREIPPLSGLCNLGNTCYVNALLQTLRFCPQFSEWVEKLHLLCEQSVAKTTTPTNAEPMASQSGEKETQYITSGRVGDEGVMEYCEVGAKDKEETPLISLVTHLHNLWQRMANKERTFVKPTNKVNVLSATKPDSFIAKLKEENPLFNNQLQQDAQEMLRYTLTSLHESFIIATKSTVSPETNSSKENGDVEWMDVIDIDSYCPKNSLQVPTGRKRKLPFVESPSSCRKASKIIKLNKSSTSKNKKVTEFFKPKQQQNKQETVSKGNVKSTSFIRDFITDCFQGQLAYQMRCYECDSCTRRTEPFLDISVPVTSPAAILPGFPCEASPLKASAEESGSSCLLFSTDIGPHSLSWALSQFALREKLRGNNKYFCDECAHFVEAERSVLFSHLSTVMTIHLNRFTTQMWRFSTAAVTVSKVQGNLAIPLSLSFEPWCTRDCQQKDQIYQLFAVVLHSGSSCSSGHYTACVRGRECKQLAPKEAKKRFDDNEWIYFDDDQINYINQSELLDMMSPLSSGASTVYILFYTCR